MKVWCMYNVYDAADDKSLVIGFKQKDFGGGKTRYVKYDTFRCFPLFWRKCTEYMRTATVNGRECYILYWALNWKAKPVNIVTVNGWQTGLRGKLYEVYNEKAARV